MPDAMSLHYLDDTSIPQLRVGTGWTEIDVKSEVGVRFTRLTGYAPCLLVERSGFPHILYVSAKSLGEPMEGIRKKKGGSLMGSRLRIRKTGPEPTSPYEVESA